MGERFWRQPPAYATHIAEIRSQGVDFAPVDVLDRAERPEDYVKLPIPDGANLKEIEVCRAMLEDYGGIVVLTNFKIPSFAGYTGAVKNIGIGLASPDGKAPVHEPGYQRSEAFFTNLADAVKGIKARMGRKMIAISILSNIHAEPLWRRSAENRKPRDYWIVGSRGSRSGGLRFDLAAAQPYRSKTVHWSKNRFGLAAARKARGSQCRKPHLSPNGCMTKSCRCEKVAICNTENL